MRHQESQAPKEIVPSTSSYEIFILVVAVPSVFAALVLLFSGVLPRARESFAVVGNVVCLLFLADFFRSLHRAPDRWAYLKKWGWLDLLGSVPMVPILRLARIGRIIRALRFLRGTEARDVVRDADQHRAQSALLATLLVSLGVFLLASILIVDLEARSPEANILTAEDGIWWTLVTIATVGYGDEYPVTPGGRALAAVVIVVGVGIFGVLTSYLAHSFLSRQGEEAKDELAAIRAELAEIRQMLRDRQVSKFDGDPSNGD